MVTVEDDLVYVPGDWVCPECNYRLHQRILRASDGAVGVSDKEGETCPNDGYVLNRLTWRQDAEDANRVALDLMKERAR
jgi:hypothetical protein